MTHEARELSFNDAQPIGFAMFVSGAYTLRVCSADTDQVVGANTWKAWPITFPTIKQASEIRQNDLKLTVPPTFPIAQLWLTAPPMSTMLCFLYDYHAGETEFRQAWVGHVANVSWDGSAQATIMLASGVSAMQGTGIPDVLQRHCRHTVYGPGCGAVLGDKATPATLSSAGGSWVESADFAGFPADWFRGGILQWVTDEGIPDWRMIKAQTGNRLTLLWRPGRLPTSGAVIAHAGCNQTPDHCSQKFGVMDSFGGFPHFRPKNPFDDLGAPIY